jgi:hypothetical protein
MAPHKTIPAMKTASKNLPTPENDVAETDNR